MTLAGVDYAIDPSEYQCSSIAPLRDGVVSSNEPNDSLFNADAAWSRYQYSWHRGSGQTFGDLRDGADPFRFSSNDGCDPWTEGALTLSKAATLCLTHAVGPMHTLVTSGDYMFSGDGPDLYRTTTGNSGEWTTLTDPGGNIQSLATDGTDLYVATSTLMGRYTGTNTAITLFGTPVVGDTSVVAFVAGHVLIGQGAVLSEVASSGALTTIQTHPQAAFRWTSIFAVGSRIYWGGFAGTRSEVYTATLSSAGALVRGPEVTTLPPNEQLFTAVAYAGVVVLGTNRGVRLATLGTDGTLTYGPLIDAFGAVRGVVGDGRFIWCTRQDVRGIGRLALDQFTDTLKPAYAYDLLAAGGSSSSYALQIARFSGRTYFVHEGGVYQEAASTYVASGAVVSSTRWFGTVEPKCLTSVVVGFDALAAGQSVKVDVFDEASVNVGTGTKSTLAATSLTVDLLGVEVENIRVTLTLTSSGGSSGTPTVRKVRLRAYPVPPAVNQWSIPLLLRDSVMIGAESQEAISLNVEESHTAIMDLFFSREPVTFVIGTLTYTVRVDAYRFLGENWNADGSAPQGVMTCRLIEVM